MADERKGIRLKEDELGDVHVANEVVAIIAGMAATEVEGVTSMYGNITKDLISRLGAKNLSKGVRVDMDGDRIQVDLTLNIAYEYGIPEVSKQVQEKVKNAIENMTGLEVSNVNVRIAEVDMKSES